MASQKSLGVAGAAEGSLAEVEEHADNMSAAAAARVARRITRLV